MTPKSVGFKIGLMTAALHFLLAVLAYVAMSSSKSSTAGLAFLPFVVLDAPLWLLQTLLPDAVGKAVMSSPLISFGVLGSVMWFVLPWLADRLVVRFFPKARRLVRWIVVLACLPLFFFAFRPLSFQVGMMSMRNERPEELQALLAKPAPGVLTRRTVLEDQDLRGICGIHRIDGSGELLVAFHRGAVRLDARYAVKTRLEFTTNYYQTVAPVWAEGVFTGQFIVHKLFEYAALLDAEGNELWRAGEKLAPGQTIDGVRSGDLDGDGRPEFAVFYRYGGGLLLVDEAGQIRWTHPIDSLGHLEMANVLRNGRQGIFYSQSKNAGRATDFTTVGATGLFESKLNLDTTSSAFALVDWPGQPDRPNLLLTEENQIRIVDLDGNEVRRLEAPGCRSFGAVAAIPVTFRADAPAYLAVRKNLHPDLAVLYVYDSGGKLVHQDVEAVMGNLAPALAAVPAGASGAERLLAGSGDAFHAALLEYSLD